MFMNLSKTNGGLAQAERMIFEPVTQNLEGVDSFTFVKVGDFWRVILFQVTIASSHKVNAQGIANIMDHWPEQLKKVPPLLVFLIPETRSTQYKSTLQKIPYPTIHPEALPAWIGLIPQAYATMVPEELFGKPIDVFSETEQFSQQQTVNYVNASDVVVNFTRKETTSAVFGQLRPDPEDLQSAISMPDIVDVESHLVLQSESNSSPSSTSSTPTSAIVLESTTNDDEDNEELDEVDLVGCRPTLN